MFYHGKTNWRSCRKCNFHFFLDVLQVNVKTNGHNLMMPLAFINCYKWWGETFPTGCLVGRKILGEVSLSNKWCKSLFPDIFTARQGNVFSCVCLFTGRGPMWQLAIMHWTSLYRTPRPQLTVQGTPALTSPLYGSPAGSPHPTEMLSCVFNFYQHYSKRSKLFFTQECIPVGCVPTRFSAYLGGRAVSA